MVFEMCGFPKCFPEVALPRRKRMWQSCRHVSLLPLEWDLRLELQTVLCPTNSLEDSVCLMLSVRLVQSSLLKTVLSVWGEGSVGGGVRAPTAQVGGILWSLHDVLCSLVSTHLPVAQGVI